MRVIVVGGGIGGLACAQGLLRAGVDVVVVERDTDLASTAGYKLHLAAEVVDALRVLVPAEQVEVLMASAVSTRDFSLAVRDHRGRLLLRAREPEAGLSLDVDRVTLRTVLARSLGEHLLLGAKCHGWHTEVDGVVAVLSDGRRLSGDLLVVANGAGSALTQTLAGRPTTTPTGFVGVAGRSPWHKLPTPARDLLGAEPMLAVGPGGTGLFATAHDPVGHAAIRSVFAAPATQEPVAIWALIALEEHLPPRLSTLSHEDLVEAAAGLLRRHRWSETLLGLLGGAEPGSVSAFPLYGSDPDDLAPWPSSRVTALGDAVHAMPPTGGQGAGTAIADARALVEEVSAAVRGEVTLPVAINDYEMRMRRHAARAVRESLQPLGWIRAAATPVGASLARGALPVIAAGARAARSLARKTP